MPKYNTSSREASNNPHQRNYPTHDFYKRHVKNLKPVGNGQLRMQLIHDAVTSPPKDTGRGVAAHIKD